jgi:sialic acid synthase SpsE
MTFKFDYKQPKIIAEIGCNHMGSMDLALLEINWLYKVLGEIQCSIIKQS